MEAIFKKVKQFDQDYGGLIRWILIGLITAGIVVADSRYMKREEIDQYIHQLQDMRGKDMDTIFERIEAVRVEAQTSDNIVRKLESRLGRIEAQNEIILKRLESRME